MVKPMIPVAPLSHTNHQIVVTDYSLAHWIAQGHKLDINEWPKQKPDHISKDVYEMLKK